jgi:hypothetical protein
MIEDVVLHSRQIVVPFSRSLGPYDHVIRSYQGGSLFVLPPPLGLPCRFIDALAHRILTLCRVMQERSIVSLVGMSPS